MNVIHGPEKVTPLSVVRRVRECPALDGQQFEHFTYNVIWCA